MLLAVEFVYRQAFAFFQLGQFFVVFVVVRIVYAFFIHAEEAGKGLHLAGNAEDAFANHNIHGSGVKTGRGHLTGHGALPNHLIELELLGTQKRLYRFRRAVYRSGADGLVRLLCVFGFGFVDLGAGGQIIGTDFVIDVVADFGDGIVRQAKRVGTHIGNQADGALPHVDAFIQLLGGAHGAVGGHAQLAHGFLLQGGGGEWRGGVAAAFFLFHLSHLGALPGQGGDDFALARLIGYIKLRQLLPLPVGELGGEFGAAFVAV